MANGILIPYYELDIPDIKCFAYELAMKGLYGGDVEKILALSYEEFDECVQYCIDFKNILDSRIKELNT